MSDFTVFTLRSVVVEECVGRGCKESEKSLCTDFWSHSNKGVQRHAGMKALFLCLRIFSRPACCELLSFCKDCTLFNNKRYKYNHLKKQKRRKKGISFNQYFTIQRQNHCVIQNWCTIYNFGGGLFRQLNFINCIHCAIEHLRGEQLPIVGNRSHVALSVKSTVAVIVSIHSLYQWCQQWSMLKVLECVCVTGDPGLWFP